MGYDKLSPITVRSEAALGVPNDPMHMGCLAAKLILDGMTKAIAQKTVTYDFARLMPGAKEVRCSEFATAIIHNM